MAGAAATDVMLGLEMRKKGLACVLLVLVVLVRVLVVLVRASVSSCVLSRAKGR